MIALILTAMLAHPPAKGSVSCGQERWQQKVLADPESATLDVHGAPTYTSISQLAGQEPICPSTDVTRGVPVIDPGADTGHIDSAPEEFTVFQVDAVIACAKKEADSDIHLCLCDPSGWNAKTKKCAAGEGLVAESPDPGCLKGSHFGGLITFGRVQLLRLLPDKVFTTGRSLIGRSVTVIGVGFRDKAHGQAGMAPSCEELHPILDIRAKP